MKFFSQKYGIGIFRSGFGWKVVIKNYERTKSKSKNPLSLNGQNGIHALCFDWMEKWLREKARDAVKWKWANQKQRRIKIQQHRNAQHTQQQQQQPPPPQQKMRLAVHLTKNKWINVYDLFFRGTKNKVSYMNMNCGYKLWPSIVWCSSQNKRVTH